MTQYTNEEQVDIVSHRGVSEQLRCLILGCSRTKIGSPELLPAIQRYDGPPFKVLRRYIKENTSYGLDVFVLSAKYGLIDGQTYIPNYDQCMTKERALEIHDNVISMVENNLLHRNYDEIFLSMGKVYLSAMSGIEDILNGKVVVSNGPPGKKLAGLRNWLWGRDLSQPKEVGVLVSPTGDRLGADHQSGE